MQKPSLEESSEVLEVFVFAPFTGPHRLCGGRRRNEKAITKAIARKRTKVAVPLGLKCGQPFLMVVPEEAIEEVYRLV